MVWHEFICLEPASSSTSSKQFVKSLEDTVISRSEILQNAVNAADGLPVVFLLPGRGRFFFDAWTRTIQDTVEQRNNTLQNFSISQLLTGLKVRYHAGALREGLFAGRTRGQMVCA